MTKPKGKKITSAEELKKRYAEIRRLTKENKGLKDGSLMAHADGSVTPSPEAIKASKQAQDTLNSFFGFGF